MEFKRQNGTLSIMGVRQLGQENAGALRVAIDRELSGDFHSIVLDLSQLDSVDGTGLGTLVALYEKANRHRKSAPVSVRLINLSSPVRQMIELMRLHRLFELEPMEGAASHPAS